MADPAENPLVRWLAVDGLESLIVFDNDLVLIDFDNAGAVVGQHLVEDLIDDAFILKTGEIIYFLDLERVDEISGFVDESDLNVVRQVAPNLSCVRV